MNRTLCIVLFVVVTVLSLSPARAETLPVGGHVVAGEAVISPPIDNALTINQTTDRSVIQWDGFNIGTGAAVDFAQPGSDSATLNIVTGDASSILAGKLTSTGSVLLINPHGITVTPDGSVDTGGAFIASTLAVLDKADFMSRTDRLTFGAANGIFGAVSNAGLITARDVLLLGSRVHNEGAITAHLGRVALGSASKATLDLTGDGFLQVLMPAAADGDEALVTNSGLIAADGGLVQLSAATAYETVREAVNMPGEVRARTVGGRPGAIVFGGGDGGNVTVDGNIDAGSGDADGATQGAEVQLSGRTVDIDLNRVQLGAGGTFSLAADIIEVGTDPYTWPDTTTIVEKADNGGISQLLHAGADVTLHANRYLTWDADLWLDSNKLAPAAGGKAGNVNLLAGEWITLDGTFNTHNSEWTLTANAKPFIEATPHEGIAMLDLWSAWFFGNNGHLKLELLAGDASAGNRAIGIELPQAYTGDGITARIAPDAIGYDEADIVIRGDINAGEHVTLYGNLRTIRQQQGLMTTLSARQVTWATEQTDRLAGDVLRFVEDGVVTRFGRGGYGPTAPGVDATRLVLGNTAAYYRLYGDADPGQLDLGDLVLSIAPHNKLLPGEGAHYQGSPVRGMAAEGIPLSEILAPGSIAVSGPGVEAETNDVAGTGYYLTLRPTADLAFKPLVTEDKQFDDCCEYPSYVSGAAGGFWIEFSGGDDLANRLLLVIQPRPVTVDMLSPSYTYGSPAPVVTLTGLVNDDDVRPVGHLGDAAVAYTHTGIGFGLDPRTHAGTYTYGVNGLTGARAGNYVLLTDNLPLGNVHIAPRALHYTVATTERTYGSAPLPAASLSGVVDGDNVAAIVTLRDENGTIAYNDRLSVGTYTAGVVDIRGQDAANYTLAAAGNRDGALTILPRAITWQVEDASTVYGTLASPGAAWFTGLLDGDDVIGRVTVDLSDGDALAFNTDAGTYSMRVASLAGADSGNYIIADEGHRLGTLRIYPKQLSLSSDPLSFMYGDTAGGRALGTLPLPGLIGIVGDDDVAVKNDRFRRVRTGESHGSGIDVGVGTYEVSLITETDVWDPLEGAHKNNYVLPQTGHRPTRITVTPRPLHYAVADTITTYGTTPFADIDFTGLLDGDTVTGNVTVRQGNMIPNPDRRLSVGDYTLHVSGLAGRAASNYTIAPTGNTPGTLRVDPKLLQPAPTVTSVYGDALEFEATAADGVLFGDSVRFNVGAKLADGTVTVQPNAGTHAAVVLDMAGDDAANYALAPLSERPAGLLTVTKRPVTARIFDWTAIYGSADDGVPVQLFNVLPGDNPRLGLTYSVQVNEMGRHVPLTYRLGVGTHSVRVAGLDDPNYVLAGEGHEDGRLHVLPKPLRYTTYDTEAEYGQRSVYWGTAELNTDDIVAGDSVWAGDVVIRDRDVYPDVLQANNKYALVPAGLEGLSKGNYVLQHEGSTQGWLTVTPKPLYLQADLDYLGNTGGLSYWTFGDLERTHGFADTFEGGFAVRANLSGVLLGDDVAAGIVRPKLEYSSQRYLAAGDYRWTINHLTGIDSHNYVLADDGWSRTVTVVPRKVRLIGEADDFTYGDRGGTINFRFDGDDDVFFRNNRSLDVDNVVIRSIKGETITFDELPARLQAGWYFLQPLTEDAPVLTGADAKNFIPTLTGGFYVEPRPVTVAPPWSTSWVYGQPISSHMMYGDLITPDGADGVIGLDDVTFQLWGTGIGTSPTNKESRLDPYSVYSPVGDYTGLTFRLAGDDAANYELIQPDYTLTITPRPLQLPIDRFVFEDDAFGNFVITYGDEFDVVDGEYGGILPLDADFVQLVVPGADGVFRVASDTDAGRYKLDTLKLTGRAAHNYALQLTHPDYYLKIDQRELYYVIGDVTGQYGNFLPCENPLTCNGGMRGPHGTNHLWVPGLTLGAVRLEGVLGDDEVGAGEITLIDAYGRTGTLDDVPPPGVYFQVIDELTGSQAHNYRIADTGSKPGILTVMPQWVRWETDDALLLPETGMLTYDDNGNLTRHYEPRLTFGTPDDTVQAALQFVWFDEWGNLEVANPRKLNQGTYYVDVVDFGGPNGSYYRPVPPEQSRQRGILAVFDDSTLGLDFVGEQQDVMADLEQSLAAAAAAVDADRHETPTVDRGLPNVGGRFSKDVTDSWLDEANAQAGAYADVLATYGVTGVELKLTGGVEVEYRYGAGYVRADAGAKASGSAGVSASGVNVSGRAEAGITAGGGVEGGLGGGASGHASGEAGVVVIAEGKAGLIYKDGTFKVGTSGHVGAGAKAGVKGGVSGEDGSLDAGVTVYSPGTIAAGGGAGVGYSGGMLSVNLNVKLALGIAGLELDLGFSLNVGKAGEAFEALGCEIGISSCPPSAWEIARDEALHAGSIDDPVARFAYLNENPQWRLVYDDPGDVPADVRRAYNDNMAFYNRFATMMDDLEKYVASQQNMQEYFFRELANDPVGAFATAQYIIQTQQLYGGYNAFAAEQIQDQMQALGVQLVVNGGKLGFERSWAH